MLKLNSTYINCYCTIPLVISKLKECPWKKAHVIIKAIYIKEKPLSRGYQRIVLSMSIVTGALYIVNV